MALILRNKIEIKQEVILETDSKEAVSPDSESGLIKTSVAAGDNNHVSGT
jgi:hypothetical protein